MMVHCSDSVWLF